MQTFTPLPSQQRGIALVTALVLLLIITIIGISGMDQVVLEDKMVFNFRDKQASIEAADSALRVDEKWLLGQTGAPVTQTTSGCSSPPHCGGADPAVWESGQLKTSSQSWLVLTAANWNTYGIPYAGSGTQASSIGNLASQPKVIMEFYGYDPQDSNGNTEVTDPQERMRHIGPHYYNIVSNSVGYRVETQSVIESTYIKRF